nr:glycoside hydrolase family 99-like domain-containing protein [Methylomarinum sp. Ch1-1]MDP4521198.1 glycoside hydrolase family 99-like domain-containing protein [Methylomarinum sp. Ch1-1]
MSFYLPQFHPIPENDEWWGKGFTEWTNTAKAKPLFHGHYQPHVPADLGFYDLRLPETRIAQTEMARQYGIEAFCYYHYWFAGKRLLERPFNEVLQSGEPDFPFCLCWANATWSGIWHGNPHRILIEQSYPGTEDYEAHFRELLPAFKDKRYLKVDGKPLFVIYKPKDIPNVQHMVRLFRQMAIKAGFPDIYLVGVSHHDGWDPKVNGFDAAIMQNLPGLTGSIPWRHPLLKLKSKIKDGRLSIYRYKDVLNSLIPDKTKQLEYLPCVLPNWDNSPRSGINGLIIEDSSPELFKQSLDKAFENVSAKPASHQLVFLKSWNEWAEGNHMEPDLKYGHAYLEALKSSLEK